MKRTVLALTLVLIPSSLACGSAGDGGRPRGTNEGGAPRGIVLVSVDAIRPDLLSIHGGPIRATNLDALAKSGIVFDDVATVCPMARPAAATLLTGVAPDRSRVRDDLGDRLPGDVQTLPEEASASGWKTAAFVTTPFCSPASGLERGFASFDAPTTVPLGPAQYYPMARTAESASTGFAKWLGGVGGDESFFAWIHLGGLPRLVVWGEVPKARERYEQEIQRTDAGLAAILAALDKAGRRGSTDVVFVGTYGALFGEDGARGSSFWLRDETLRVPLVVAGPLAAKLGGAGSRDRRKVWLPDVAATLRTRIGSTGAGAGDGVDLANPGAPDAKRVRYAWTWAPDDQVAWPTLTGVRNGSGWSVFRWDELKGPAGKGEAWALAAARPATPRERALSETSRAALAAAGVRLGPSERRDLPPQDGGTAFYWKLTEARLPFVVGVLGKAKERSASLVGSHPGNFAALFDHLLAQIMTNDVKGAFDTSERLLAEYPLRKDALHWAAHVELNDKDVPRAEALIKAAIEIGPAEPEMIYDLACVRALRGDRPGAIEKLREAVDAGYRDFRNIERDPDLSSVRSDPAYSEVLRRHSR